MLELKLRGLEGRIRKGACNAFSRPGERMERPCGQGGAQPSSEMSGESHYPLQQKYPPEWGDIFVKMMIGEWDSKGTSPRGAETIQCIVSEFPGLAAALPQCRRESHYPLQKEQAVTRWLILFAGPFAPSPRPLPMI